MGKVTINYQEKGKRKKGGRESQIMNTQHRLVNRELKIGSKKLIRGSIYIPLSLRWTSRVSGNWARS